MHLSQVDLNLFVVLEAIYREGNLTRAGRQLKLTQPAMSHALKRLRELLQDPLFIREGANMVPTPFSRNMINEVRQALQILEVNLYENRNFDPAHTRRNFQIGFWELMESTILPPLAKVLARAAPEISITTLRVKRREIEQELASGTLDLVLDIPITISDNLRQQPLVFRSRGCHGAQGASGHSGENSIWTRISGRTTFWFLRAVSGPAWWMRN